MPGYCHRHKRDVPATLWMRCRTSPEFCQVLDRAHGVHAGPDSTPDQMPAIWKRAITFALAMAYWWWYDGCRAARPVVIGNRNLICKPCQHNIKGWCSACGCKIAIKTMIPSQRCPKRHWHAVKNNTKESKTTIPPNGVVSVSTEAKCGCGNAKQPS